MHPEVRHRQNRGRKPDKGKGVLDFAGGRMRSCADLLVLTGRRSLPTQSYRAYYSPTAAFASTRLFSKRSPKPMKAYVFHLRPFAAFWIRAPGQLGPDHVHR